MSPLKLRLVEGIGITWRLCDSVTDALGTGVPCEFPSWSDCQSKCGRSKAGRRFSRGLLRDEDKCDNGSNYEEEDDVFISQGFNSPKRTSFFSTRHASTTGLAIVAKVYAVYTRRGGRIFQRSESFFVIAVVWRA